MKARLLLAATLLSSVLGGCAGPSDEVPTLTALEAYKKATAEKPGLQMAHLRGMEGSRPGPRSEFLGLTDDGLPDGPLGDGRLSSWVVAFLAEDALIEVRVFADGRESVIHYHDIPEINLDGTIYIERPLDIVDSDVAAERAATDPGFLAHVAANAGAGFVYTKLRDDYRYGESGRTQAPPNEPPAEQGPAGAEEEQTRADFIGWPARAGSWSVVHFPLDGVDAMAQASVANDGALLDVRLHRPVYLLTIADQRVNLAEPMPPALDPIVRRMNFTVPRGSSDLTGAIDVPALPDAEYHLRVVAPDGTVFYDSEGQAPSLDIQEPEPMAGTWTIEVTHTVPAPTPPSVVVVNFQRSMRVDLEAFVPLLAAT